MAYYELEPFGEDRADLRMAILATLIANANTPRGKRRAKVDDFMPKFGRQSGREPQSWEDQLAKVEALNAMFGGADLRRSKGVGERHKAAGGIGP